MPTILSILFLISLAGVIYPFRPFRKRRYALLFAIASFIGVGVTAPQNETGISADSTRMFSQQCASAEVTGVEYGIAGSRINVRKGPGTNYEKIVNQKATSTLGKTHYIQIDNSVTVLEACRKGDWSFIQVISPDWLRDSHQGWVASRFLRGQLRDAAGVQVFTEQDFIWDKNTSPYKDIIVPAVNKIHRENSRCKEIDPSSAYISGTKSSPGKPVFFVTCGYGAKAFNVWFSKDDLGSENAFEAAKHIDKATGISADTRQQVWILETQDGVRQRLKDPSSAEFRNSRFVDFEGIPIVCGEVNGKNSFGAYGGFQHFIASGTELAFLENDMEASEFRTAWNKMCAGR